MTVLLVQWPSNLLVKLLNGDLSLFGDVSQDRVDHLALVVSFLAFDNVFWGNSAL
jgi:hypothetical protein